VEKIRDNLEESHNVFAEDNEERADWSGCERCAGTRVSQGKSRGGYFTGVCRGLFPLWHRKSLCSAEIFDASGVTSPFGRGMVLRVSALGLPV